MTGVFGESKHLLCKWHTTHAWRRKLTLVSELIQDEAMQSLLLILNEKDEEQFGKLQNGFLKRYSLVVSCFARYFPENYMNRVEKWTMCFRQFDHCQADTNMFVESFHNKLKAFFKEKRPNKRQK